jgi:hypothetical protein
MNSRLISLSIAMRCEFVICSYFTELLSCEVSDKLVCYRVRSEVQVNVGPWAGGVLANGKMAAMKGVLPSLLHELIRRLLDG